MRQQVMTNKQRLTVNLEATEFQELQNLAQLHNVSMAWLGRRAIVFLLAQNNSQREIPFLPNIIGQQER